MLFQYPLITTVNLKLGLDDELYLLLCSIVVVAVCGLFHATDHKKISKPLTHARGRFRCVSELSRNYSNVFCGIILLSNHNTLIEQSHFILSLTTYVE